MEYNNPYLALAALLGALTWSFSFWRLLKPAELYLPFDTHVKKWGKVRVILYVLGLMSWGLIGVSVTGPRKALRYDQGTSEVNDIFFAVDTSRSMLGDDFSPNRLEAAKLRIRQFVELLPHDRIGIVAFGEKPFTLLPLTTDLKLISHLVGEIEAGMLGPGTNIGEGLGLAIARLAKSETKSRVVILLTDGVHLMGSMTPEQAAQEAKKLGIKIYTIGIGRDEHASLPGDRRGANIPGGSFNYQELQKIAQTTGAMSYRAENSQALENVFNDILKLERTEVKVSSTVVYDELYYPFFIAGFLLFVLVEGTRLTYLKEVV